MFLPLLLIALATLSAAVAVYGTLPQWVLYQHGMQVIEISRRLQWPLFTLAVLLCLALAVLIIVGKKRAWWLLGFAPVLALFAQQFATGSLNAYKIVDNPAPLAAENAAISPQDYVVGARFGDSYYAFPYRYLYYAPIIVQNEREKRYMLIWSAFANRAIAWQITRQIHPRELDIVSMPANALLIYNGRNGQFINGLTGLTTSGSKPDGFVAPVPTVKMPWGRWRALHPQTKVVQFAELSARVGVPVLPQFPIPPTSRPADPAPSDPLAVITLIPSTNPVALQQATIPDQPQNIEVDGVPILLFRDPSTGLLRGYDRRFHTQGSPDEQPAPQLITSRFIANPSTRRAKLGVAFIDVQTNSGWNLQGVAVDGINPSIKGTKLRPIPGIEEDLYWNVMKHWYPELQLLPPQPAR